MPDIKVEISELEKYRNSFLQVSVGFNKWLYHFLEKSAEKYIKKVKLRTPVDTGKLKDSWIMLRPVVKSGMIEVVIVNTAYYASFVEFGHAKPYKSGASPGSSDWVDGYFVLTITEEDVQRILPKWFERDFIAYMKSGGIV